MCIVGVLFCSKIVWNIFTPIVLARRSLSVTSDKPSGVSMAPLVEIILLLILCLLAAFSSGTAWFNRPMQVLLWGSIAIVVSHVLCGLLAYVLGWLILQIRKRKAK
jgi:hypothetical protein